MTTSQAFKRAQITHAVIVDDAFDELPARPLTREEASGFFAALSHDDFDKIRVSFHQSLSMPSGGDEEETLIGVACTLEGTRLMYGLEAEIDTKVGMFEDFRTTRSSRLRQIEPLCNRLRELEVAVQTFGSEGDLSRAERPQLVFIDLQLKPVTAGSVEATDAIEVYKALLATHPDINPPRRRAHRIRIRRRHARP
jgi:hypothetical protein